MKTTARSTHCTSVPRVSRGLLKMFTVYSGRYVRRRFHSFRVLRNGFPPPDCARPLVIYLNHAGWWDPLICLLLARRFFPSRSSFAPMDGAMLRRYRFFRHLGFFGLDQEKSRGAVTFVRMAQVILASSANALWLTPQGRFMDVRERPLRLQNGLGLLACRKPDVMFVPLAIEYSFWTEPNPEALVAFGEPIVPSASPARTEVEWTQTLSDALEFSQDELAARSCRRDPADWLTLDRGRSGVNAFYDAWRHVGGWIRGEKSVREHFVEANR